MIEDVIRELIGAEISDNVISHYISKACLNINTYLNRDFSKEECIELYKDAVISLAVNYDNIKKQGNVSSMSQGQRSITYKGLEDFTEEVKSLLPKPFIKLK